MDIVTVKDVNKTYTQGKVKVQALRGVSLDIETGGFVALAGPSGSGKTTLLNIIGGLDLPDSGDVTVDGSVYSEMSQSDLAKLRLQKVGFIFQAYNLIPVLSALENVEFVMLLQGVDKKERRQRAAEILDDVGLEGMHHRRPAELSGGQTRDKENELLEAAPALPLVASAVSEAEDETRFLDLTRPYEVEEGYRAYHRLDRLSLTYQPSWGMLRLGRQAVTWGNGLLFNPMDLFNPFSPTTIDKDYKTGDDMAYCRVSTEKAGSWQFLYVPRRDAADGEPKWERSSLAAKVRYFYKDLELNLLAAEHYTDEVAGLGLSGYLGGAAWRVDATRTFLDPDSQRSDFWNLTANMDYSWTWWGNNCYGFLEYYHSGLGTRKYEEAVSDPELMDRVERGEAFVLGKDYLAGHLNIEVHPLVNLYLTVINNLHDPSGSVQPRLIWDSRQNVTFTLGSTLFYGEKGTEFGGIEAPSSNYLITPAHSLYLWATLYF